MSEIYLAHYELYDLGWFAPPYGNINSMVESYSCFVIHAYYIYIYNVIHILSNKT